MKRTHCLTAVATLACFLAIVAGCNTPTVQLIQDPDYLTSFPSPPLSGMHGQQITVKVCTTNSNALLGANMASITDLYINTSPNINGATWLTNYNVAPLAAKGYTNWTVVVTIPANQTLGSNYLVAVCNDDGHKVPESNYNDNTNTCAIIVN